MISFPPRSWNRLSRRSIGRMLLIIVAMCAYAAGTVALGLHDILYAVAGVYVPVYLYAAWKWPQIALLLIFAAAPIQNEISGGEGPKISAAEVNFILALPIFFLQLLARRKLPAFGPLLLPGLLYLSVCLYSTLNDIGDRSALLAFGQMLIYMTILVGVFSSFVTDPKKLMIALYGLVCVGAVLGSVALVVRTEYMLGLHKNALGGSQACALIVAVELWLAAADPRRKRLLSLAVIVIGGGLLISLSRGGWLGAAAGLSVIFLLRRDFRLLLRLGLLMIPVIAVLWVSLPQESREYATSFSAQHGNIQARLDDYALARHYFEGSPIFGIGIQFRKQSDATNIVLFTLAETGIVGLITFSLLYATFFKAVWQMHKKVLPGDPLFSLYAVGSALLVARLAHGMVDHYWGRGPTFMAWSAFGMFVAVSAAVQQRESVERIGRYALSKESIPENEKPNLAGT